MSFNVDEVVINDGNYCYFRPSMVKMKNEVKHEIKDYVKETKMFTSILHDNQDLTAVDLPYNRICFVRNRMKELSIENSSTNAVEIMILLGIEHKLNTQLNDVYEFINNYQKSIENLSRQANKCKFSIYRIFRMNRKLEDDLFPLIKEKCEKERKLEKFEREQKNIENLLNYIKGKILYLTDGNISKLGLVKD